MTDLQQKIRDALAAAWAKAVEFHQEDVSGLKDCFDDPDKAFEVLKLVLDDPATLPVIAAMAGDDLAIGVSEGTNVGAILDLFLQFYNLHGIIERAKGKITTP
jgi:hypothetical protein